MRLKSLILSLALVGAMAMPLLYAAPAQAQATRTWVSGLGDDANPCSRTAPCKTFPGAISKTAAGGEIDALDPGGFGTITITKAITIDGGGGQVASILASGTAGVNVNAGATDIVILRNLRINGTIKAGSGGSTNGVNFNTGAQLIVENCDIFEFGQNGISITNSANPSRVDVINSVLTGNSQAGILVRPGGGLVNVALKNVVMDMNGQNGLVADGTGGGAVNVAMQGGSASNNGTDGVLAKSGPQYATVIINQANVSHNGTNGIQADQTAGSAATIIAGASTFDGNAVAAQSTSGGTVGSYSNNYSNGNTANNGTFTAIAPH